VLLRRPARFLVLALLTGIALPAFAGARPQEAESRRNPRRRSRPLLSDGRTQESESQPRHAETLADAEESASTEKAQEPVQEPVREPTGDNEPFREPNASFDFGGRVQMDYTIFRESEPFDGTFGTVENSGEFRRLRARASGHVGRFDYKVQLDFAGQEVNPNDLYVGLRGLPVTVRAGYEYEPWSLEQQTSDRYMTFMERSLAVAFSPDRNLGLRVIKNYDDKTHWSVGVYRETIGWETKPGEHYNLTARATHAPIASADQRELLHFGVSYTHKFVDGAVTFRLRPDVHSAPPVVQLTVPASSADYLQFEASSNIGSLQLQAEYVHGWVQSVVRNDPKVWAVYGQTSFFLTGENRPYAGSVFGRVKPKRSLFDGGPGAIEIKARYSFADFSSATESGMGQLAAFTTGVNWYWTSHLRTVAEFSRSTIPDRDVSPTSIWNFRFMTDW